MAIQTDLPNLQQELVALQKQLQESEQDKIALLKAVSHDVKAPLNQIYALTTLMKMTGDNLTDEQIEYVDRMDMVVKEGLTLVRNLLDLRTLEYRDVQFREDEIDLEQVFTEVIKNFQDQAANKGITIVPNLLGVKTRLDKLYVGRVFDNLLSNAIKFSPRDGVITIEMGLRADDVLINVIDQGEGIPSKERTQLFKKFATLSPRPTAGEATIGLGLYLAQQMAIGLEGNISFLPEEKDTTFQIILPLR
jgi:two-component system sensor histidine kinase/response regulator